MKRNKWIFTLLLIGAVGFISIAATRSNIYKQIRKSQSLINDVYRYLITDYVDDLDIEKYTRISIDNMLMDLDPYTVFMEKEEKSGIELLTKGKYGGVGIQIGKREKELTVISPMDDSPAKRMGILSGDVIVKIDTVDVSSVSMDEAAKLIRGQKGTIVVLTIDRFGVDELMDFPLTREEIKVKDVSYSGLIDESTGYIRLTRFSRNSAIEMKKAVDELMAIGINSLVIDLRDNPGGLLNSAVDILDLFIEKDEFDNDIRLLLNFGHTFGHALEGASNFKISHGIAVGLGMLCAHHLSRSLGLLQVRNRKVDDLLDHIFTLLQKVIDLPLMIKDIDMMVALAKFQSDKKHSTKEYVAILFDNDGSLCRYKFSKNESNNNFILEAFNLLAGIENEIQ